MSLVTERIGSAYRRELARPADRPLDRLFGALARWWPLVLIVCGALYFLPGLDVRPLRGEEGRRALMALAMLEHGAWWRLEVLELPYVNKPPLLPWMIAGFASLFGGINEVAVRLPNAILTIAGAIGAGALAMQMAAGPRRQLTALLAGLAFLLTPYIQMKTRVAETDAPSVALVGLAFMAWALGRLRPDRMAQWWVLSAFFVALAGMLRGPVALVFAAVPMLATGWIEKDRRQFLGTLAIFAAGLLPCVVWAATNVGEQGGSAGHWVREMRLIPIQSLADHVALVMRRAPRVVGGLLPWLVIALAWGLRRPMPGLDGQRWLVRALLLYIGPLSLLVMVWPETRERYVMPIAWPIAVLAGVAMAEFWNRSAARIMVVVAAGWLAFQYGAAFVVDGTTATQRAIRADAQMLRQLVGASGPGEFVVVAPPNVDARFDVLGYLPRSVPRVDHERIGDAVRYVLASGNMVDALLRTGRWKVHGGEMPGSMFLERASPP